jgi:predicted ATPase/DNA-binding winged helix-turn-helix (wHTH) protein
VNISGVYRSAQFEIDGPNRRFLRDGVELTLEPKVLSVILELLSRSSTTLTRDQLLDAVWGHRYVTPSTLSRVIKLARRAFNDDADQPRFIHTVHGVGYRFIGPIDAVPAAKQETPSRFAPPSKARIPARIEALIGRERELAGLDELFSTQRAVTLVGSGGMGKTQCALEFARRQSTRYADGVWFFDLAPLQTADDWLLALASALAIPAAPPPELLQKIIAAIAHRELFFLVDNCDRIAEGTGTIVVELLRAAARLRVLATSQQHLNYVGEHVMRIPSLVLPAEGLSLSEIEASPAVALLLTRIKAIQPNFALNESNALSLAEICRQLDGMPLALELAAARFSLLSAAQVLERLKDRFRFLVSELAGRERRHRNLLVLLDWSFKLLSPQEQRLLSWLSVCVQGWTVETAIDLGAALGDSPENIVDLLNGLVTRSLVGADTALSPPRYRLLESVREFGRVRLREADEERQAGAAHLDAVRQLCERAYREMLTGRMKEWVARLEHEHGNIESAIEYSVTVRQNPRAAWSIVGSLLFYFKARGPYIAARRWTQRAVQPELSDDSHECGRALLCLGVVNFYLASLSAEQNFRDAIRIANLRQDAWGEGCARAYYAMWLVNFDRSAEAPAQITAAAALAERLEDEWLRGRVEVSRSWVYFEATNYAQAIRVLYPVRRLSDDFDQHIYIDIYLALANFHVGDYAATARHCRDALRGSIEAGNWRGVAGCVEQYAYVAQKLGSPSEATRLLGVAQQAREVTSAPLVRLWLPLHAHMTQLLRAELGSAAYEAALKEGREARLEDAANEVMARLKDQRLMAG